MDTLQRLQEMVTELNLTNSSNDKMVTLAKYSDLKEILNLIYSDFFQFGVTSENILKLGNKIESEGDFCFPGELNLEKILMNLSSRLYTGHEAIAHVHYFIKDNSSYSELILNAIDKNLKCRIDSKLINKVFPDCIQTFDVALAKSIDKVTKKPNFAKEDWYGSRKLDGVRCVVIKQGDDVKAYSRTGKPFETIQIVLDDIKKLPLVDGVFDGELCLIDENGKEDFQNVMKEIRRKDHQIQNPRYMIFDLLSIEEFTAKSGNILFSNRLDCLNEVFCKMKIDVPHLKVLQQIRIVDQATLDIMKAEAQEKGFEGVMLRKDCGYEGKRSNNLLKVKSFFDDEYEVKDIELSQMRIFLDGVEKDVEVMGKAIIEHKGFKVGVGSGWTPEERLYYKNNPGELIGKLITVKYFSESVNQDGGISLRFPTVKAIHGIERED